MNDLNIKIPTTPTVQTSKENENIIKENIINVNELSYISSEFANKIDSSLFECGYSIDQLMELAGLAIAQIISQNYKKHSSLLIISGPGNNGGDGRKKLSSNLSLCLSLCLSLSVSLSLCLSISLSLSLSHLSVTGLVAARHLKLFGYEHVTVMYNLKCAEKCDLYKVRRREFKTN
jgi:hypothetical protein